MNRKVLATIFTLTLLLPVTSVAAFWHPPDIPEDCTVLAVLIEGEYTNSSVAGRFNFTEPEYTYSTDFTVEVVILNAIDLYGYDFYLGWDETFFELVDYEVHKLWEHEFPIMPDAAYAAAGPPYKKDYHQAAIATAGDIGVNGDLLLATLTFHIINDVCWACQYCPDGATGVFDIRNYDLRDSCTNVIEPCSELDGYWRFLPTQPWVWIDPPEEENCVVGEKFTMKIMIDDIVKMKGIHFKVLWNGYKYDRCGIPDPTYMHILKVDKVVFNDAVFLEADWDLSKMPWPEGYNVYENEPQSYIECDIWMECTTPLINITEPEWIMEITFEKQDPWFCGGQPDYDIDLDTHVVTVESVSTPIWFAPSYIQTMCCGVRTPIEFGKGLNFTECGFALHRNAEYTFAPVPGDLNGDGVVEMADLMIIAVMYCNNFPDEPVYDDCFWLDNYDFDDSGHIGIEDLILVAKNIGACCHEPC